MTRKISLGITAILVIVSVVLSSVVTLFFILKTYDNLLVDLPQRAEQYLKLAEIDELIRNEYYGSADEASVDDSLASGYIKGLNDPYSFYVAADDIEAYTNMLAGKMEGVGLNAYYDSNIGKIVVSYVHTGSPADNNGISENDIIISVNGDDVTADNYSSIINSLTATFDKKVRIVAESDDESDTAERIIEMTTGYEIISCSYLKAENIGYIRLSSFYDNTLSDFNEAIEYFKNEKISNIILDLRNSSGQNYDVAAEIIDSIVPVGTEGSGAVYIAKNLSGDIIAQHSSDVGAVNMKFAVLVNDRTEAAAELVAADLRDFGKGILIGETTAGCGTMQKLFALSDSGAVYLTVAEVFPYISDSFNGKGLAPDIIIESSESFKNQLGADDFSDDEQYKTAVSYFNGK